MALAAFVAVVGWGSPQRAMGAPPKFHVTYEWTEKHGPLSVKHAIHLYGNGTLRHSRATGFGPPSDYTPPRDLALAIRLKTEIDTAMQKKKPPLPPCGAPRGGGLTVEGLGPKKKEISLNESEGWMRYGRIARALVDEVMGAPPEALESDCRPLQVRLKPAKKRAQNLPKVRAASQEDEWLKKLGSSDGQEARREALSALAWMKGGDVFFKYALLRKHPTSAESRALLRHHAAVLTRNVHDVSGARWLLQRFGRRAGPEYDYHRALLYAVVGRLNQSLKSLEAFAVALGRDPKKVKKELSWLKKAVDAQETLASDKATWGARRRAHSRMFALYERLTKRLWMGKPEEAPPLAVFFIRRAAHQARLAFFSRGPTVRGRLRRRGKTLVMTYYHLLVKGHWYRHPVWHRLDLMALTGYLRRNRRLFKNTGFSGPDSPVHTVERLVRLRRFKAADRFVERIGDGRAKKEAPLRLHQGRALLAMERWKRAQKTLMKGAKMGSAEAWAELVMGLVEQGALGAARQQIANSGAVSETAEMKLAEAFSARRQGHWKRAMAAAKKARERGGGASARRALGLARAARGELKAAVSELTAAYSDPRVGCRARAETAELYIRGKLFEKAKKAIRGFLNDRRCSPAWGHALLAAAALKAGRKPLSNIEAARADFHARWDPDACIDSARVLIRHGVVTPNRRRLLRRALARRPHWSIGHALLARLYAEQGALKLARGHARVALKKKPLDPAYRALYRTILKAGRSAK